MSPTSGPWAVSGLDPAVVGPIRILSAAGTDVPQMSAVARVVFRGQAESDANARLIAAAPELLAALKVMTAEARQHNDDYHHVTSAEQFALADAAIRKAEAGG